MGWTPGDSILYVLRPLGDPTDPLVQARDPVTNAPAAIAATRALVDLSALAAEDGAAALDGEPPSWPWFLGGILCLGVAAAGAIASSSLLLYSPAKLGRFLNGNGEAFVARLSEYRASYHALARSLAIIGVVAAGVMFWHAAEPGWSRTVAMSGLGIVAVVVCGVLPGSLAAQRAEQVVVRTNGTLESARRMLHYPVLVPLLLVGRFMMRILRIKDSEPDADAIADEILAAVEDKTGDSGLDEEEREWIENIVALKDTCASEIMTPRTDTVAFSQDMPLLDAIREATAAGFSRFPVYNAQVDNVVGVFYAKDVLPLISGSGADSTGEAPPDPSTATVGDYMRKPLFVSESMDVGHLLRHFRTSRVQLAVVLDEYGGTAGLVSIEDVLEEIVGEITDEYDPDEEIPIKVIEEHRVVETSGRVRIEEINEVLPVSIPETEDYDTVAGFVFTSLDRIPRVHEQVEIGGVEFEVLDGDDRRINRLRLTVTPAGYEAGG